MRDNLVVIGMAVVVLVATAGIVTVSNRKQPVVYYQTNCRLLDSEPGFYADKQIQLSTEGMQPGDDPRELVFRRRADLPPVVVCRFPGPVPSPVPAHVVGACGGRLGACVIVTECRAAP